MFRDIYLNFDKHIDIFTDQKPISGPTLVTSRFNKNKWYVQSNDLIINFNCSYCILNTNCLNRWTFGVIRVLVIFP